MLLIFDCDGVIVDSMLIHNEVEAETYRKYGIDIPVRVLAKRYAGISLPRVFKMLEDETGIHIPLHEDTAIEGRKFDYFAKNLKPIAGIHDALKMVKDIPRCIASGSPTPTLKHMLTLTNLYDDFAPNIFSSDMVARGKPFPDLFLHAAKCMGHAPDDCLVIEDGVPGVKAARAAGMRVIGFTGGAHCDEGDGDVLMREGAFAAFSNMRELPERLKSLEVSKITY